ncbi:hypothetical protein OAD66_04420 [Bacteroidia bacterium]|nr:hypothetical protein [Bacteroidia bacterium]
MSLSLIISLVVFGIFLILIEVFITPGFIVGVIGLIFIIAGVVLAYRDHGSVVGNIALGASALILSVSLISAFRNGAWNKFSINDVIEGKANNIDKLLVNIGDIGKTMSALRPAGQAMINGQKLEVTTEADFVLANEEIIVTKKSGNKIIVKPISNS